MSDPTQKFIFACTQNGVESACKQGILAKHPELRFAFSRPGFLTFKVADGHDLKPTFELQNVFVRCSGFSGERVEFLNIDKAARGTTVDNAAKDAAPEFVDKTVFDEKISELLISHSGRHVHIWSRDMFAPGSSLKPALQHLLGTQDYMPGTSVHLGLLIDTVKQLAKKIGKGDLAFNQSATNEDRVLDLILVEPNQIWTGWHLVKSLVDKWPGGIPNIKAGEDMISRAYLKMNEALTWSRFPLAAGDTCTEIGAAPGGSCQALLDRKAKVIGIDPAEVDERIMKHANFQYIQGRGSETKVRDLRATKWLFSDTNVAPAHTLDTVERIVTNDAVKIRGMILTLKLSNLELASEIPKYIQRVRDLGFSYVRVRQLAHNRGEFCLAALRNKGMLRFGKARKKVACKPKADSQK